MNETGEHTVNKALRRFLDYNAPPTGSAACDDFRRTQRGQLSAEMCGCAVVAL